MELVLKLLERSEQRRINQGTIEAFPPGRMQALLSKYCPHVQLRCRATYFGFYSISMASFPCLTPQHKSLDPPFDQDAD